MASIAEITREHTGLSPEATQHLQKLVTGWGLLADFCFADLLLFAPAEPSGFVVLGHIRPTTSQTLYRDDLIGQVIATDERPLVDRAFQQGEILEGEITMSAIHERVRVQCIPVAIAVRSWGS